MKTLAVLCILATAGFGIVQGSEVLCVGSDIGDTIDQGCVNCTCVQSPSDARDKVWTCTQTCPVCPATVISMICLVTRCDFGRSCPLHPNAMCVIPACDKCEAAFMEDGQIVDCTTEKPGMCPMPDPGSTGTCEQACSGDADCPRKQKCCSNGCGQTCQVPAPETCPPDKPFTNCTYSDVCSSPCSAAPAARCLVDHCGGCRPVYITALGSRINCTTGQILRCKPGMEMVNCLVDPCANAECPAAITARCVSMYCGGCHAIFVNDQGQFINCTSGAASYCPPGLVENPATTSQACAMATCPTHPRAQCTAKKCLLPNSPLQCPYEFFDASALPVQCDRVKRGRCPRLDSEEHEEICVVECSDDTECEEDKKCCPNECGGGICRDPEDDDDDDDDVMDMDSTDMAEPIWKPGTCPMPPMGPGGSTGGACVQQCNPEYGDAGCPRHWKCCGNGCGHVCRPPREVPGQCPTVDDADRDPDMSECQAECSSDDECRMNRNGSRCCDTGCGTRCTRPVTSRKPGTCPEVRMGTSGICMEACTSDDDCENRAKCCSNGCGHMCMEPREQPGECPARPDRVMLRAAPQVTCTGDGDCSGLRSKCCAYGCGQICVEPVRAVKPGMCPMPDPDSAGTCEQACSGDDDCPGTRKCCSNGCGQTCQVPVPAVKPSMCPMPDPDSAGTCEEACSGDADCPRQQKCCSNGCGQTCQVPVPDEKPGMCPMPRSAGACVEACRSDRSCPRAQKCCSNGCGRSCQTPVPRIVGVCPTVSSPGSPRYCNQKSCSDDEDCPGLKTCCDAGCDERVCLAPQPQVVCEEELEEMCDFDPCEFADCPSAPNATCGADKCGRCRPTFYDQDLEPVTCSGKRFCTGLGEDNERYESGYVVDSSNGCQQCVCTPRGSWTCSIRTCDKVVQVSLVFNVTFDGIMQRKFPFIGKLKKILAEQFGLPANAMRDFKLRQGSVIVDFKVSSDGTSDVNIDEAVAMMGDKVAMGQLSFEFEGERVQAKPDSFVSKPYMETTGGRAPAGAVNSALSVVAGTVIAILSSL